MSSAYVDDSAFNYTGSWVHYRGTEGTQDATEWFNETFSSHAYDNNLAISNASLSFIGTGAAFFSEFSTAQGRFFCFVDNQDWQWYNGGSAAGIGQWQLNTTRCAVSGLSKGPHTLTLGQTRDDGGDVGISLDYAIVDSAESLGLVSWSSPFDSASPPANLADTTNSATASFSISSPPVTTSSASASTIAPSGISSASTSSLDGTPGGASSSSAGGGLNSTALGAGLGAGLGGAALLLGAGFAWYRSRRNRGTSTVDGTSYDTSYGASSSYAPTSYSPSDAEKVPRMRSLSTTMTTPGSPSDGSPSTYIAASPFHFQRRPSAVYPEVQEETHITYPSRQQNGLEPLATVSRALADPQSFSPRH
ncbi:hypothetical protein JCM11251_005845 [Rhodosporidiobolus azoricus]